MAESKDSFIRWQGRSVEQLSYANNLFLGFSTATLGFALSVVKDQTYQPNCAAKITMLLGLATLSLSILIGAICAICRLYDFRTTAGIARHREKGEAENHSRSVLHGELRSSRSLAKALGSVTWVLFRIQVFTFLGGAFLVGVAFAFAYSSKLG